MTFEEYIAESMGAFLDTRIDWRFGQALFNVLATHRSDLSEQVRGTEYDPYYAESNGLGKFLMYVEERW